MLWALEGTCTAVETPSPSEGAGQDLAPWRPRAQQPICDPALAGGDSDQGPECDPKKSHDLVEWQVDVHQKNTARTTVRFLAFNRSWRIHGQPNRRRRISPTPPPRCTDTCREHATLRSPDHRCLELRAPASFKRWGSHHKSARRCEQQPRRIHVWQRSQSHQPLAAGYC